MNYRIAMSKLLQRTCLGLKHNAELHTKVAIAWRCHYKQLDKSGSPCSSNGMTTLMTSKLFRCYSKFTSPQQNSTAVTPLSEENAYELVLSLKDTERSALKTALDKYDAVKLREGFEGKLAATQWRTRFGRLSKVPPLSNVDPSGSFCTFPKDWLKKKAEANAKPPTSSDLYKIFWVNAVPFVVFGFLDNFCMIMAGDYIEQIFGTFMCISTMAAAGLGNTISDILGIGSAFYVERFCTFMGLKPPDLGPIQMEMKESRRAANWGRIIGITIGCLLGMCPLLVTSNETSGDTTSPSSTTKEQPDITGKTTLK